MRIAVIMDPIEQAVPDKDTTVVLMREAEERGHEVKVTQVTEIFAEGPQVKSALQRVHVASSGAASAVGPAEIEPLDHFDAVLMRKDPPVNEDYLYATYLLSLLEQAGAFVLNRPRGLRDANEKLYVLNFPDLVPETFVSRSVEQLKEFMRSIGGEMIVKPIHGWGGLGVFFVSVGDRNVNAILETATDQGSRMVVAQRYIPEVRKGDKRVILLDGEPIGAVCRVPTEEEHRSNIHVGGQCVKAELSERERRVCAAVGPRLREDGLYLAGLDLIGGFLTEVNVTSPTGVQEINRLDNVRLEEKVIDFVEAKVTSKRG